MANVVKVTKKDNFQAIETILREMGNETLADVMAHEIELLAKKKSSPRVNKNAGENEILKGVIEEVLATFDTAVTVSDLQKADERLSATLYSNQRITSILTKMVDANIVSKASAKGKSVYSLA